MKKIAVALALCTLFFAFSAHAEEGLLGIQDNIYIKQIDAFSIYDNNSHILRILATFKNDSASTVRIRDGYFKVVINPDSVAFDAGFPTRCSDCTSADTIFCKKCYLEARNQLAPLQALTLGRTQVGAGTKLDSPAARELKHLEIPAKAEVSTVLDVSLPSKDADRAILLLRLTNYLGMPDANKKIALIGNAEVGKEGNHGWAYQRIDLELWYAPKLQSEVLMN